MQADSKNGGYFCQHDCSLKCRFTVYSSTSVVRVTREASRKGAQGNPRQEMQMGTILRILPCHESFFHKPQTFSEKCRKSDSFSW